MAATRRVPYATYLVLGVITLLALAGADANDRTPLPLTRPAAAQGHHVLHLPTVHHGRAPRLGLVAQLGGFEPIVAASGAYAYVAGEASIVAYDVTHPEAPRWAGQSDPLPGRLRGMTTHGRLLLAVTAVDDSALPRHLVVFGLGRPARPREIGRLDGLSDPQCVIVADDMAYVADGPAGVQIVDLTRPTRPTAVARIGPTGNVLGSPFRTDRSQRLAYRDGLLYIGTDFGIKVVDVRKPASPRVLSYWESDRPDTTTHMYLHADGLLVRYEAGSVLWGRMAAFDLADPTHPVPATDERASDNTHAVTMAGDALYVLTDCYRFGDYRDDWCLGLRDPSDAALRLTHSRLHSIGAPRWAAMIEVNRHLVIFTRRSDAESGYVQDELRVLAVSLEPVRAEPRAITQLTRQHRVLLRGDHAFVSASAPGDAAIDPFFTFDLRHSDPLKPLARLDLPENATLEAQSGGYAYVRSVDDGRLLIADARFPAQPQHPPMRTTVYLGDATAAHWPNVYTIRRLDPHLMLEVIDTSAPSRPRVVGALVLATLSPRQRVYYAIEAGPSHLLVAMQDALRVVDVADPARPALAGEAPYPERLPFWSGPSLTVVRTGDHAYVNASVEEQLLAFDVSDPAGPRHVATLDLSPRQPAGLAAGSGELIVADRDGRVWRVDVTVPDAPRLAEQVFAAPRRWPMYRVNVDVDGDHVAVGQGGAEYVVRIR